MNGGGYDSEVRQDRAHEKSVKQEPASVSDASCMHIRPDIEKREVSDLRGIGIWECEKKKD